MIKYFLDIKDDDVLAYELKVDSGSAATGKVLWYHIQNISLLWGDTNVQYRANAIYHTDIINTKEEAAEQYVVVAKEIQEKLMYKIDVLVKNVAQVESSEASTQRNENIKEQYVF